MEPTVKPIPEAQAVQVLDERGQVIGVISRPVAADLLGPGREKVYLARHRASVDGTPHAA